MKIEIIGIATALVLAAGTNANASDYGAPPAGSSWTGFYVGGALGAAWADQDVSDFDDSSALGSGKLNSEGLMGGLYLGGSTSIGSNLLVGIEGDFSWADLKDSAKDLNRLPDGTVLALGGISWDHSVDWLASIRGRVGLAVTDRMLAYVTGGVAWMKIDYNALDRHAALGGQCPNCTQVSESRTESGGVVGGGLEWSLNPHWALRGEYLHYVFEGKEARDIRDAFPDEFTDFSFHGINVDVVRAGVTYRFGAQAPIEAMK